MRQWACSCIEIPVVKETGQSKQEDLGVTEKASDLHIWDAAHLLLVARSRTAVLTLEHASHI